MMVSVMSSTMKIALGKSAQVSSLVVILQALSVSFASPMEN